MYFSKKIIQIVATGLNGEIGANNDLLWHIPDDLKHFKEHTLGQVCIAGRKTVQSFPKPLSKRIILPVGSSIKKGYENLDDALGAALHYSNLMHNDAIYIIGGASIYEQTKDITDKVILTTVNNTYNHADTFYSLPEHLKLKYSSALKTHKDLNFFYSTYE